MRAALQSTSSAPSSPMSSGAPRGRHRFVQDGDIPVVVVNRRPRQATDGLPPIAALEQALGAEREARAAAERALQQAQEKISQLQMRLAHAESSQDELRAIQAALQEKLAAVPEPIPAPVVPQRRPKAAKAAQDDANEAVPAVDVEAEAVEWWRPGWRERLRSTR